MISKNRLVGISLLVTVCWVAMRSVCASKSPEIDRLNAASAILTTLNIPHKNNLESINAACQANLLRKPGSERWQMEANFEAHRATLMPYLQKLGMCQEYKLTTNLAAYDYIVFMGAMTERVHDRISYLKDAIQALPDNHKPLVVLLTGMRPLDPLHEDMSYGSNEAAMMEAVYKGLGLGKHRYEVVSAPMKGAARPTTDDTVYAWLATHPKPGRCLVVSSQPFVQRQADVVRALLPKDFSVDVVGKAAKDTCSMAMYLDELGRTVYQAKQLAEKNK